MRPADEPPVAADACDVLIVGAGPTGLVLALWLNRLGVKVRIIDQAASPGTTSRALVVHARTLELYQQLGIANLVVARALPFTACGGSSFALARPIRAEIVDEHFALPQKEITDGGWRR